jgi:hypothetical protein
VYVIEETSLTTNNQRARHDEMYEMDLRHTVEYKSRAGLWQRLKFQALFVNLTPLRGEGQMAFLQQLTYLSSFEE